MENKSTIYIDIYRDGQLSRWETLKPLIYDKILSFGNYLDQVIAQNTIKPQAR